MNGTGNDLNNLITGASGNNALTGGAGADVFLFNQDPSTGVDTITDFSVVDDVIQLDSAIFTAAGPLGALAAEAFVIGADATTAAHRFIYNASTGALFYDEDGVGGVAAQQIAQLGTGLGLTNADFSIV